jgi:hypothetical protein
MLDVLLAAISLPLLAMGACGADPAISSVVATPVADNGNLSTIDLAITLKNVGTAAEPSSLLQSIVIYQDATKVDQKGAQPLGAGAAETVHYRFSRSSEARMGSTHMRFQLVLRDPHAAVQNCSTGNDTYRINV